MYDTEMLLADLAALDPIDAYRASVALHWRIRDIGATKGAEVLQSILPNVAEFAVDVDHEYDDNGGTYRVFNSASLSLLDGRTLELPDESRIAEGSWVDGCCCPHLDDAAESRVDARMEADPTLDRSDAMLIELGADFGLDLDAMHLLVDVASFLAREGDEGGISFRPCIPLATDAPAGLTTATNEEAATV